jgi:hypothetical protein
MLATLCTLLVACACEASPIRRASPSSTASTAALRPSAVRSATPESTAAKPREPSVLLSVSSSAYRASIAADAETAHLLTSEAAYRLSPGRAPETQRAELGLGATATPHALLFWADGEVQELSKHDSQTRRLVALATRPQTLVASESGVGWVERSEAGRFALGSISGKRATRIYTSPGRIDAAVMSRDWIFFLERPAETGWRVGGVRASGGTPEFTSSRPGRAPSMLVARRELYYYDGNRREVRRLSPDLRNEETLATDFVCSPLAVAERVYCANVEGIFELVPGARPRALVKVSQGRLVTGLAASATHVYWVADVGPDKLEVSALPLGE